MKRGQGLLEKGKLMDESGRYEEAIEHYECAVKLLLEVADNLSNRNPKSAALRLKCLIINERIKTICNLLDTSIQEGCDSLGLDGCKNDYDDDNQQNSGEDNECSDRD